MGELARYGLAADEKKTSYDDEDVHLEVNPQCENYAYSSTTIAPLRNIERLACFKQIYDPVADAEPTSDYRDEEVKEPASKVTPSHLNRISAQTTNETRGEACESL